MENGNGLKKKLIACIESGIELDKDGHAFLRMDQRKISFETVKNALKSYDKIGPIKEYKPESIKNAYRVFIKLTNRKALLK